QDQLLAASSRDRARVQKLQERTGVLQRSPAQVLDVGRPDLVALAQQRDELRLNRIEGARMEEKRFLHAHELPGLHEHLEKLVLLVTAEPGPAQRLLGTRRGGLRPEKVFFQAIDDALLLGRQAHLVRGESHLVAFRLDGAPRDEQRQEKCEYALVGAARTAAELLAGPPGFER